VIVSVGRDGRTEGINHRHYLTFFSFVVEQRCCIFWHGKTQGLLKPAVAALPQHTFTLSCQRFCLPLSSGKHSDGHLDMGGFGWLALQGGGDGPSLRACWRILSWARGTDSVRSFAHLASDDPG